MLVGNNELYFNAWPTPKNFQNRVFNSYWRTILLLSVNLKKRSFLFNNFMNNLNFHLCGSLYRYLYHYTDISIKSKLTFWKCICLFIHLEIQTLDQFNISIPGYGMSKINRNISLTTFIFQLVFSLSNAIG